MSEHFDITDWDPEHAVATEQRLGEPAHWTAAQGRALLAPPTAGVFTRALAAHRGADPAGVGVARAAAIHPTRLWVFAEVAPDLRRRRVGTALLGALREACAEDGRAMRTKVAAGSEGAHFAAAMGFSTAQRSRILAVDTGPLASPDGIDLHDAPADERTTAAWWAFYRWTHDWDPPADVPLNRVRQQFLSAALPVVAVRDGAPVGIALLAGGQDTLSFVGGPLAAGTADGHEVAAALLTEAARRAAVHDAQLTVEIDDSMSDLQQALGARTTTTLDETLIMFD